MNGIIAALPSLLGQTALSSGATLQYLNLAMGIVASGVEVYQRLRELDEEVARQVAAGRDPTPQEWQTVIGRARAAHGRIQAAAASRPETGGA